MGCRVSGAGRLTSRLLDSSTPYHPITLVSGLAAAVLADARAAGETGIERAADQAGVARAVGAGGARAADAGARLRIAGAELPAEAGTAVGAGVAPVAVAGARSALIDAGTAALTSRRADATASGQAGAARAADQTVAAGMANAGRAAAPDIIAMVGAGPCASEQAADVCGYPCQAGPAEDASARGGPRQRPRQRIESSFVHDWRPPLTMSFMPAAEPGIIAARCRRRDDPGAGARDYAGCRRLATYLG